MGLLVVEVEAKSGPLSESKKFRQPFSILLYHHFQLQSECLGGLVLDQFDAPNPPVASICPWDCRLLRYKQNRAQFLRMKNSASFYSPPLHHFQLQSECLGALFIDQINALNPAVASIFS